MRITKLNKSMLGEAAALEAECVSHPWSRESLEAALDDPKTLFLAAVEDERLTGYVFMSVILDEGYICNVAVNEAYRRRGTGSALIRELVTYGKKNGLSFITLEVRKSNLPAISLYSHFGFVKVGERKDYYSAPKEDAVLMTYYY
jgi:ribosomal-protein-alanine N-acetyltransferase